MHVCESLLQTFGKNKKKVDEQRSKVAAHEAARKVIRVIPAPGSSCSFPPLNKTYNQRGKAESRLLAGVCWLPISCISSLSYRVA